MKKLILTILVFCLLVPVQAGASQWCILIIERIGDYPAPVDPENITAEEQVLIDAWQARYDNHWGLMAKIARAEDWLLTGPYQTILNPDPNTGPVLTKAGQYGVLHHWPLDRIINPSAVLTTAEWFAQKMAQMIANGWGIRGWVLTVDDNDPNVTVDSATRAFLLNRNYAYVE